MKRELTNPQIHVALCNGIACFVVAEMNYVGFSCRICVFLCYHLFSRWYFFLIQNSPSPFCSLGFSSLEPCMAYNYVMHGDWVSAEANWELGCRVCACWFYHNKMLALCLEVLFW